MKRRNNMQPKRFFAENTQTAFRLVKESLGTDAVILSNRTLPDGVEVIAGDQLLIESAPVDVDKKDITSLDTSGKSESNGAKVEHMILADNTELESEAAVVTSSADHQLQPMMRDIVDSNTRNHQELTELKRLMISELSAIKIGSWKNSDKERYRLFKNLIKLGFSIQLTTKIVSLMDASKDYEQMWEDAQNEIKMSIHVDADSAQAVEDLNGIVMLHGMTGAGKTSTIAKIAAQVVAKHGPDEVVLICADNRRMGAHNQLLGYGKILEIPVLQVRKNGELIELLSALRSKRLVLVDQPGISPSKLKSIDKGPWFHCDVPDVKHYLTLAATTQSSMLNRLLGAEWNINLEGVVVTKTDEVVQLGEILSCLIQNQMPVVYVSGGQSIRKDLQRFDTDEFVQRAVELGESLDESMDQEVNSAVKTSLFEQLEFLR